MEFPRHDFDYAAESKRLGSPSFCEHVKTELRCKPDKNKRPRYHHQCISCGRAGLRVSASEVPAPGSIREWDHDLQNRVYREFHERMERHRNSRVQAARKQWEQHYYGVYLRSPEWQERRRLVLLRAQGNCEGCRLAPATDVHHRTYDNVGHEFLFELLALCRPCHDRYHEQVFSPFLQRLFFAGVGQPLSVDDDEIDF